MSQTISGHLAGMRRQLGRVHQTAIFESVVIVMASAVLVLTLPEIWQRLVLLLLILVFLQRKVRLFLWARRVIKQLRLEEQFVCHELAPTHVRPCLNRWEHLWASSLTLQGLKRILSHPLNEPNEQASAFHQAFDWVHPSRIPYDLVSFVALLFFWLWATPGLVFIGIPLLSLVGCAFLLVLLGCEVFNSVLIADLKWGIEAFISQLREWYLSKRFEDSLQLSPSVKYQHTLVYRAPTPASKKPDRRKGVA